MLPLPRLDTFNGQVKDFVSFTQNQGGLQNSHFNFINFSNYFLSWGCANSTFFKSDCLHLNPQGSHLLSLKLSGYLRNHVRSFSGGCYVPKLVSWRLSLQGSNIIAFSSRSSDSTLVGHYIQVWNSFIRRRRRRFLRIISL